MSHSQIAVRARHRPFRLLSSTLLSLYSACSTPILKEEALDPALLARDTPEFRSVVRTEAGERIVRPTAQWLAPDPGKLAFAGYREGSRTIFCVVLGIEEDTLTFLPLREGESPLDAGRDPRRRAELLRAIEDYESGRRPEGGFSVSFHDAVKGRRLGPPIPRPGRILAVAANFPSHLRVDLDMGVREIAKIGDTPPRLFQKYPPVAPPSERVTLESDYTGIVGPYDPIRFPMKLALPQDENGVTNWVNSHVDYEAEIGIVLDRDLTWEEMRELSDQELYRAVAGYVLISDIKARNPQVFERALHRDLPAAAGSRYMTMDPTTDLLFGNWDAETCKWWSYAASFGDFAAIGPWFVPANGAARMPDRAVLAARSYSGSFRDGHEIPAGRNPDTLYLRQCSMVTEGADQSDALLWRIPQILRGVLEPGGALALGPGPYRLKRGDVIALGTPAGIVLTVRYRGLYRFLGSVLFWWSALDWHDAFFGRDAELYLHHGDEVMIWGEGLGFQQLEIRRG